MLKKEFQILSTKNYTMFKYIGGNRNVDEKRVLSIMDKMKNFPDTVAPAQCNEHFAVIDGQHRLEAAKRLGRYFYYYVVKGAGIETVRAINDHDSRWSTSEFASSFSSTGNKDYEVYEQFEKKYKFGHAINIMLLTGTDTFYNQMLGEFKTGGFKVTDLKKSEEMAEMLISLKDLYAGYKKRTFAVAFVKVASLPGFNFTTFTEKLRYQQKKMVDCTNSTHYIELLGEIYNYKSRKGTIIDVTPLLYKK